MQLVQQALHKPDELSPRWIEVKIKILMVHPKAILFAIFLTSFMDYVARKVADFLLWV